MTERERLIELIEAGTRIAYDRSLEDVKRIVKENHHFNSATDRTVSVSEMVADFLLENGVIVPPVYVGGTVYEIRRKAVSPSGRETNCGICTISFLKHCINIGSELYVKGKPYVKSDFYRLGKTVFLTREEAEKALKEREENA